MGPNLFGVTMGTFISLITSNVTVYELIIREFGEHPFLNLGHFRWVQSW